jgi:uncharacterized protein with HEPN domain
MLCKKLLKEIDDIETFVGSMTMDAFEKDEKTRKAVVMSFINMGELANAFSDDFTQKYPNLPLKKVRGLRNIAAHRYEAIQTEILWDTIQDSLPALKADIGAIYTVSAGKEK